MENLPAYVGVHSQAGRGRRRNADRYKILSRRAPIVQESGRGELFAVFDGIGSTQYGGEAAQLMCDCLVNFYRYPEGYPCSVEGITALLWENNRLIDDWGMDHEIHQHMGGCAGTVLWIYDESLILFHAGDTTGLFIAGDDVIQATTNHNAKNGALERFFGQGEVLVIDSVAADLTDYSSILLLSDGVSSRLEEQTMVDLVAEKPADIAAKGLVRQAVLQGSMDDSTALVIDLFMFE